jgi:hypothetical protein
MQPDPVFVACGIAATAVAGYLSLIGRPRQLASAALWALLGAGLFVQGFAPHLRVEHNAFRLPSEVLSPRARVDPRALVERTRREQMLSAILTIGASIGLALYYRRLLVPPNWRESVALSARKR